MIKIKSSFLTGEGILHYVVVAIGAIMVTIPHFTEVATAATAILQAVGATVALLSALNLGKIRTNLKIAAIAQTGIDDIKAITPITPLVTPTTVTTTTTSPAS